MALGSPVQLRLSPDQRMIYEDEAAQQGKAFATYLRERLILMRAVARPDRIKMAHAELRRQGFSVWSGREV